MAAKKVRVPLHLQPRNFTLIEDGATAGATVGVNVFNRDGTLWTPPTVGTPSNDGTALNVLWRNIREVPDNVVALAETDTTGLYVITGAGTSATRTLVEPAAGLTIANPDGIAGNPTFALADDLLALEDLSGTGFGARIAADAWALRTWQNGDGIDFENPDGVAGDPSANWNSRTAKVPALAGSTYDTAQKLFDLLFSPGILTGGVVTALNPTTTRVLGGTALLRIADDNVSELRLCNFADADFPVPDVQTTHFYALDYSGGTPVVVQALTDTWDRDTQIPLGSAFRLDGALNVTPNPYRVGDVITNLIQRADAIGPVLRDASVGGLGIGNAATRRVTVSPGRLWSRVSDFPVPAKNSTVDPMFSAFFNGTNLTVTSGLGQWDNLNYNNMGTGTLVPLGNNKFANIWIFMSFDGTKYGFAYGTAEHNSVGAAANEGIPPYLTQNFFNQALLLGRFIIEKGVDVPVRIESAFTALFNTSAINDHNQLSGLQVDGGAVAGEYYHLSAAQATTVAALNAASTSAQFWRGDKVYSNNLVGNMILGAVTTENRSLDIGFGRSGDGLSFLDLVGDTTYSDYGLRMVRNGGANASSGLTSRGTGSLFLQTQEAGAIALRVQSSTRLNIDGVTGMVTFPVSGAIGGLGTGAAVNGAAGTARRFRASTDGSIRWEWGADGAAETPAGSGSNWVLNRHDDAGTNIGTVLTVSRATGAALFSGVLGTANTQVRLNDASLTSLLTSAGAEPRLQVAGMGPDGGTVNNRTSFGIARFFNDNGGAAIYFVKSRGATVNANNVASVDADFVGRFLFEAANGAGLTRGARYDVLVDGTPVGTTVPMRHVFTTMNAAGTLADRWNIRGEGHLEPIINNAVNVGSAALRPATVYGVNGDFLTSLSVAGAPVSNNGIFAGPPGTFTMASLASPPKVWMDADERTALVTTGTAGSRIVTAIASQFNAGTYPATPTGVVYVPRVPAFNNHAGLFFGGNSASRISLGGTANSLIRNVGKCTMVFCGAFQGDANTASSGGVIVYVGTAAANTARALLSISSTTAKTLRYGGRKADADAFDGNDAGGNLGSVLIIVVVEYDWAAGVRRIYVNGQLVDTDSGFFTPGNVDNTASDFIGFGAASAGDSGGQFYLSAAGIHDDIYSTADRQKIEGLLANRLAQGLILVAGHPYRNAPP